MAGNQLLIPGGRSVPACYDRTTGKLMRYQLAENGKRGGGHEVVVCGDVFFNGGGVFAISSEKYLGEVGYPAVVGNDAIFSLLKGSLTAIERKSSIVKEEDELDKKGNKTKVVRWTKKELGSRKMAAGVQALIQAGPRLYAASGREISAVDFHRLKGFSVAWTATVPVEARARKRARTISPG